uniref:Putative salivary secreted lipocalin n=1 Tax=Ornithodoros turicata TaxID=34597 RepID=A0A2R5LCM7_9ACAR
MFQLVVFLTGCCCFVATVHAACNTGPFDAQKSIVGPGSGLYKLVKTTYKDEKPCVYVTPTSVKPTKANPQPYPWGYKENGEWVRKDGEVYGEDNRIVDKDQVYGTTTTTLVYSDYKTCDVGLFQGGNAGGPHVELWLHSDAKPGSEEVECCQKYFQEELTKQKKTFSDAKDVDSGCGDYPK